MKIKSLNTNTEHYGFPSEMEYTDKGFHGHQLGIAIGVINNETQTIERNLLSENLGDKEVRDTLFLELINDKKFLIIENKIHQLDDENKLVPKTIFYFPYYVVEHSAFMPTTNFESLISGMTNQFKIELLFVDDGLNRYVTIDICTANIPVIEIINDLFKNKDGIADYIQDLHYDENEAQFILDFYNEAGERTDLYYDSLDKLKEKLMSVRVIGAEHIIREE